MKKATTSINALASVSSISEMKEVAWEEVKKSFESFCLMAGVESELWSKVGDGVDQEGGISWG